MPTVAVSRPLRVAVATIGLGLILGGCGTPAGSAAAGSAAGGAYGDVTAGPTCPVERADHPCPPRPVDARVDAEDAAGHVAATTHTDQAGGYRLSLAAGSYTLVAVTGGTYPRCPRVPVTVRSGVATRADIACDTGIR